MLVGLLQYLLCSPSLALKGDMAWLLQADSDLDVRPPSLRDWPTAQTEPPGAGDKGYLPPEVWASTQPQCPSPQGS